jgi:uncharacterized protein YcbK (DUF882 family)
LILQYTKGKPEQVSLCFRSSEFDCRCTDPLCTVTLISGILLNKLDEARMMLGEPLVATSGFRCGPKNALEGGKPHSFHTYGMAVDIMPLRPESLPAFIEIAEALFADNGIGYYSNRLHLDMGTKRTWGVKNAD